MSDVLSHYDAIVRRIANEKARLAKAERNLDECKSGKRLYRKTDYYNNEIDFRKREIASAERELANEIEFLKNKHGIDLTPVSLDEIMSDDELLKELGI